MSNLLRSEQSLSKLPLGLLLRKDLSFPIHLLFQEWLNMLSALAMSLWRQGVIYTKWQVIVVIQVMRDVCILEILLVHLILLDILLFEIHIQWFSSKRLLSMLAHLCAKLRSRALVGNYLLDPEKRGILNLRISYCALFV